MNKFILPLCALALCAPALAKSSDTATVLFDCTTRNGKRLLLTEQDGTVTYRFGKKSKPELSFTQPKSEVRYRPWKGIGRHMTYSLILQNAGHEYQIFHSGDKQDQINQSGVWVNPDAEKHAEILCRKGSVRVNLLEELADKGFKTE